MTDQRFQPRHAKKLEKYYGTPGPKIKTPKENNLPFYQVTSLCLDVKNKKAYAITQRSKSLYFKNTFSNFRKNV